MILIILGIAFVLRLVVLDQSYWLDEAISVLAADKYSYSQLLVDFPKFDFHPPLFYLILKFWGNSSFFGFDEIPTRILPILFGVATVFVVFKIAGELKIKQWIPTLLLATSPLHIYYSQEVRMYPLVAFTTAVAFLFFVRLLSKERPIIWALFSLSILTTMTLDYLPVFILPVFWILPIFYKKKKDFYFKLFLAFLPLIIISILWLPVLGNQVVSARSLKESLPNWAKIIGSPTQKELALIWVKFIVGRISFVNKIFYALFVLVVSAAFGYVFLNGLRRVGKVIALWVLTPIILGFVFSFFIPAFSYFRFLYILPAFYLILAYGVKSRRSLVMLLVINLVCLGFYYTNKNNHREQWREAVRFLEINSSSDDIALFEFREPVAPYTWYRLNRENSDLIAPEGFGAIGRDVDELTSGKTGVWYFEYLADITDPDRIVLRKLESLGFEEVSEHSFIGVGSIAYLKRR